MESAAMKEQKYERNVTILNVLTVLLITYLTLDVGIYAVNTCSIGHSIQGRHTSIMFTTLFAALGLIFFISGMSMAISLKKYYPDFYKEYGRLIWLATCCLTLPLFIRSIHSSLYHKGEGYKYFDYYESHFATMNIGYVLFSSILPIVAQMTSLLFGARQQFKRNKENKINELL